MFHYCVWLTTRDTSYLEKHIQTHKPHISLKTNLTSLQEAQHYKDVYSKILRAAAPIRFSGSAYPTCVQGPTSSFYAVQVNVDMSKAFKKHLKKAWRELAPTNPHLSFIYSTKPISKSKIQKIENISKRDEVFHEIEIWYCSGPVSAWYRADLT